MRAIASHRSAERAGRNRALSPIQIEIANEAVEANLNDDGSQKYDSAQGYACAISALQIALKRRRAAPNGDAGDAIDYALGHITNPMAKLGFLDDWRDGREVEFRWPGYIRWLGVQRMGAASVDTHPKDGDVQQAPLVSGAVPKADAR